MVERQGQWLSIHYTIKKKTIVCKVVGGARAVNGQAQCLEDKILQMFFGLESGVTTEGWASLVLYYDHINSIIRNTQLLYMLLCFYWLPNFDIPEIFHNSVTIAFYLNYNKGL